MRVVRIVALLIATVAATLHGAVDHAPSAIFQKRKRYRNAQAAQQSKAHIRPIAGSLPGFCQYRERDRQGKCVTATLTTTWSAKNMQLARRLLGRERELLLIP